VNVLGVHRRSKDKSGCEHSNEDRSHGFDPSTGEVVDVSILTLRLRFQKGDGIGKAE
jgi:hypothetical protein